MLFRIVFLIVYQDLTQDAGIADQILALVYGLKLDVSLTGYILGLPTLVLIIFSIFNKGFLRLILGIYTFLILLCLIMAFFTNLVIYKYWNSPIDRTIFDYISTPDEMMASLSAGSLFIAIGLILILLFILYFLVYEKWVAKPLSIPRTKSWITPVLFSVFLPSLLLPIRGGLATSPIQTGSVYFHNNIFINHAAVNPVWKLIYTLMESDHLTRSAEFYSEHQVQDFMEKLYDPGNHPTPVPVLNTRSPNIILIIFESFGQPVITGLVGAHGDAAPNINKLVPEGIFFDRFFATGTLTDRALGAALAGYPAIPGTCVVHFENKAQKLPSFNKILKSAGYQSAFLYGGDIDFGHINSFIVINGFDKIISDKDFSSSIPRSSWGVPDHIAFERLMEITDQASSPFFHIMLTLSSHTPFDVPMETVFPGSSKLAKFKNSVYYTDKSLGEFIRNAKTRDWWDHTLIILTADHGCRIGNITAYEEKRFNIPLLWLGGALSVTDTIISKYESQTDLPATLLNQMKLPLDEFMFSKDILSPETKSFAYYTYNDGIGFISDSSYTIFSLITGEYLLKESAWSDESVDPGLAYIQYLFTDFNSK